MTLIFIGQNYKYELESICKLFFQSCKIHLEYETTDFDRDELIITRQKRCGKTTRLLVVIKLNGKLYRRRQVISNDTKRYEKTCERLLCQMVFEILSEVTGSKPSWGTLTGIRPVKNLHWDEQRGVSLNETDRQFREDYLVSESKIDLCHQIYEVQKPIFALSRPESVSLYVSIPFCPSRCSYCSFVSQSIASPSVQKLLPDYLNYLIREIDATAAMIDSLGLKLETVYFGGGTPTSLSAAQLRQLCDCIDRNFSVTSLREYTVEAGRADTIDREKLQVLKDAGVSRISINPQTFQNTVLEAIGRRHTAEDVIACYELARKVGHTVINMDFIAGLPTDTESGFRETMDLAISLAPENITVHTLSVKRASNLMAQQDLSVATLADPVGAMVDYAQQQLLQNGYLPYYLYKQKNTPGNLENVGYCKKGYEGLYNIYMMEEVHSVLACGGAAVTKLVNGKTHQIERIFNYKYPYEYIKGFDEILTRKAKIAEILQTPEWSLF